MLIYIGIIVITRLRLRGVNVSGLRPLPSAPGTYVLAP